MTTSSSQRPVIRFVHSSVKQDERNPQWWMHAQQRGGMMMSDRGCGYHAQRGDY